MSVTMTRGLQAFCDSWKQEIKRLEAELERAHQTGSVVDATGLAIAITIRQEAVDAIEAALEKKT